MTAFEAYQKYLALKLHFSPGSKFNFHKSGRTNASPSAFEKRKDRFWFEKAAKAFDAEKYINKLLVEQLTSPSFWVKDIMSKDNEERYLKWKGYIEAFEYNFKKDISKIRETCIMKNISLEKLFSTDVTHPKIFKMYLKKEIALETFYCICLVTKLDEKMNQLHGDDPVWAEFYELMHNYSSFISSYVPPKKLLANTMLESLKGL